MRLPVVSGRDAVKALCRLGFEFHHQTGSHLILSRRRPLGFASIPNHPEIRKGTLLAILRKAGVTREEFLAALR
ncbi:MAG TPA: type II toxin-antitoxin system HicA family toxin [Candidatus Thermoplasmatota archaeon]|nr:type II toxin-antitoxin system HicA family toxin [Candidatus Thermoplasmatota archaeon]